LMTGKRSKRFQSLATPPLIATSVTDRDANTLSESAAGRRSFAKPECAQPSPSGQKIAGLGNRGIVRAWSSDRAFDGNASLRIRRRRYRQFARLSRNAQRKRLSGGDRRVLTQPGRPVLRLRPVQMRGVLHSQQVARILRIDQQRRRGLRVIE